MLILCNENQSKMKNSSLNELFSKKIPENIKQTSLSFSFLNEFMRSYNSNLSLNYDFSKNYQWKENVNFKFNLNFFQCFLSLMNSSEKKQTTYRKKQLTNSFYGVLFENFNKLTLNNFKIVMYEKKIQILEKIIEKMKQNQNYNINAKILYLKSTLFESKNQLNTTEIEKLKNEEFLNFFQTKNISNNLILLNSDLDQPFLLSMKESPYIKMSNSLKRKERLNQINLNLELNKNLLQRDNNKIEFSLFLGFKKSNLPNKYTNLIKEFENQNVKNFNIIKSEIFIIKKYLFSIFDLLISNINILISIKNTSHISNDSLINAVKNIFHQLDEVCYNIEVLILKNKNLIELIGFEYVENLETESYSLENFQNLLNLFDFENFN